MLTYYCPNCAYDLRGGVGAVCPECGEDVTAAHLVQLRHDNELNVVDEATQLVRVPLLFGFFFPVFTLLILFQSQQRLSAGVARFVLWTAGLVLVAASFRPSMEIAQRITLTLTLLRGIRRNAVCTAVVIALFWGLQVALGLVFGFIALCLSVLAAIPFWSKP